MQVAHHIAHHVGGHEHFHVVDGLEHLGIGVAEGLGEGVAAGQAEGDFVGVDGVHLAVVDAHAHVAGIGAGEGALLHAVHQALDDGGDEAGVDGAAHDAVAHHELAAPCQGYLLGVAHRHLEFLVAEAVGVGSGHAFGVGLNDEVHLAELSGAARLFLVAVVGARGAGYGLAVGYLGLVEHDGELVVVFHAPFEGAEVELALAREDGLFQFFGLLHDPCGVFLVHAGEYHVELFGVAFGDGAHGALIFGSGIFYEVELDVAAFLVEGVAGAHVFELDGCADVAGFEAVDGCLYLAAHAVNLGEAFF